MNTRTGNPPLTIAEAWQQGFDTGHYLPGEDHHCPCNVNPYIDPRDQPVPDVTGGPEVGPTITITRRKYTFALLVLGTLAALLAGIGTAVGSAIIFFLIGG